MANKTDIITGLGSLVNRIDCVTGIRMQHIHVEVVVEVLKEAYVIDSLIKVQ